MVRRYLALLVVCAGAGAWAATEPAKTNARDLYLGEAFFYAQQGEYFDAISRLDTELSQFYRLDEPNLDPFHIQLGHAEFSVGDFELYYRMHKRAGRAMKAVIEGNVSPEIRNEAAYRLARIYYEKSQPEDALHAIERIVGKVPERIRHEERFLRAQIYMVNGRFADAVDILEDMRDMRGFRGFAGYNLGMALFLQGKERAGIAQLDRAGQVKGEDEPTQAIRDKANLVLGYRLLEAEKPAQAKQYLDRVRMVGPFSDKALLGSGWSDVSLGRFDRALVPWSILVKRNPTDKAVQESLLGVPYSYAQLGMHGRAALLYGEALDAFGKEMLRVNASIQSVRNGNFLEALVREELKQDKNWAIKLRELPEAPETWYLTQLMASNDFQSSLRNYQDLEDLRKRLKAWEEYLNAYEQIIELRRRYYEPLLPDLDRRFRSLDSRIRLRLEQRQSLADRLHHMLVAPRPDFLATADERIALAQIAAQEDRYRDDDSAAGEEARRRIQRLRGVIRWDIHTSYDQRLTDTYKNLRALDKEIAELQEIYGGYVRTRQAATQSYQGYDAQLTRTRVRIREASTQVATLMARQGRMIEMMAINEFEQRRKRIEQYQVKARFAMAESYDRALKSQQTSGATDK
jgi:hypothetical protein